MKINSNRLSKLLLKQKKVSNYCKGLKTKDRNILIKLTGMLHCSYKLEEKIVELRNSILKES